MAVLPPGGQPAGGRALHVGAAGRQAAPLLSGRLHPGSVGYATPGAVFVSRAEYECLPDGLHVLCDVVSACAERRRC